MIKINLLESITDKPASTALAFEKRVASANSRFYLLTGVVTALLVIAVGYDYFDAHAQQAAMEKELADQQEIARQNDAIIKEQNELDQKIKNIDSRIEAIKDLRSKQAGPSAVLEALRERIGGAPGLYLESVDQKGEQLTIKGNSPDEFVVTNFGRSLEFSSGLFSNLNIETQRKEVAATQIAASEGGTSVQPAKRPETVNFTIRCAYTPSKAAKSSPLPGDAANPTTAANAPKTAVQQPPTPGAPPAPAVRQ